MQTDIFLHNGLTIHYRPNTLDRNIFEQIHVHDEYALGGTRFNPDRDMVLDIGAHAGYFALAALLRGAAHVHLFEMAEDNIALCRRNLRPFRDHVTIHHAAVWHTTGKTLSYDVFPDWEGAMNTGGITPYDEGRYTVPTVAFDDIMERITKGFRRKIRLVKIDAEGAEWPILLTAGSLHAVEAIVGEYHEIGGVHDQEDPQRVGLSGHAAFTRDVLARHLRQQGFRGRIPPSRRRWGLFHVRRPRWRRWLVACAFCLIRQRRSDCMRHVRTTGVVM